MHVGEEVAHVQTLRVVDELERAVQISSSACYSSQGNAPAIRVLRQAGALAQLLARLEVLQGGLQVVPLAVDSAYPDVHVRRSAQNWRALLRRQLQCVLMGAQRLAQTTLRNPNISQRERAAESVGVVSGPPQARHPIGIRLMSRLEISARPPCQSEQHSSASTPQMVILRCDVKCPTRVLVRQGEIAQQQRVAGPMYSYRAWEPAELCFVHHDHLGIGRVRSEPALSIPQAPVGVVELTAAE